MHKSFVSIGRYWFDMSKESLDKLRLIQGWHKILDTKDTQTKDQRLEFLTQKLGECEYDIVCPLDMEYTYFWYRIWYNERFEIRYTFTYGLTVYVPADCTNDFDDIIEEVYTLIFK